MRFVSIATLLAACATSAWASPLVRRAVYAGELVNPKADDTIAIDQQFQFAYLPAVLSLPLEEERYPSRLTLILTLRPFHRESNLGPDGPSHR